jgi:amidophosphoribosyltransferase
MIAATEQAEERLCTACFTGTYPIEPPIEARHLLMQQPVPAGVVPAPGTGDST